MLFWTVPTVATIPAASVGERATDSDTSNCTLLLGAETVEPAGTRVFKSPTNKPIAVLGEAGNLLIPV
ncbi:hypothetical protein D3C86_1927930 [compost metagenome]